METTLKLFCEFIGWQGGTLTQALNEFRNLPMSRKDAFCGMVMRHLDAGTLADVEIFASFTRSRIGL